MEINLSQLPWWILLMLLSLSWAVTSWWTYNRPPLQGRIPLYIEVFLLFISVLIGGELLPVIEEQIKFAGFNGTQASLISFLSTLLSSLLGIMIGKSMRHR